MFLSCPCSIPNLPEMQDTSLALEMADNFLEKSTDSFLLFMIEDLRLADISHPSLFKDQRLNCVATELLLSAPCRVTYAAINAGIISTIISFLILIRPHFPILFIPKTLLINANTKVKVSVTCNAAHPCGIDPAQR